MRNLRDRMFLALGDYTRENILAFLSAAILTLVAAETNLPYLHHGLSLLAILLCLLLAIMLFPRIFRRLPSWKHLGVAILAVVAISAQLASPGNMWTSDGLSTPAGSPADVKGCFGMFSGTVNALRDQVKSSLNDPSSFELIKTETYQALDRDVTMTFRTKNQFNATVIASVNAQVNPETCAVEAVDQPTTD